MAFQFGAKTVGSQRIMKVAIEYTTHSCQWVSAMKTILLLFSRFQEDLLLDSQSSFNSVGIVSCGSINGKSIISSSSWLCIVPSPMYYQGAANCYLCLAKTLK
ncbi:hypothetical protein AMTRI_Chr07g29360 [Amborella trichopoda]